MLYQIKNGTISLKGEVILDHINFEIKGKEKIALVGENGAGKSTLLKLINQDLLLDLDDKNQDRGIYLARNTTIGMLSQEPWTDKNQTLEEEIKSLCEYMELYSREKFDFVQEYDRILTGLGFCKEDKYKRICQFSGGEQTKLALIKLLLQKPDILLLDEPTNHLDTDSIVWLENYLAHYENAVLLVSHDRFFLDKTVNVVYEVRDKKLFRYAGNYSDYKRLREAELKTKIKEYKAAEQEKQRLNDLILRFKHKPNKASMARSKKKMLERMPVLEKPRIQDSYYFPEKIIPLRSGSKLIYECKELGIGYTSLIRKINLTIRRGQKIGIIGKNGSGKSAFLKTLLEEIPAICGQIRKGTNLDIGYFDQHTMNLPTDKRVIEWFQKCFPEKDKKVIRDTLAKYRFYSQDNGKYIGDLSGGEKARLALGVLLEKKPNVLCLDEPTNHMDIPSKEVLESAFKEYTGTILFITHDRYFLKEVASSLLIFEENETKAYSFPYTQYLEMIQKKKDDFRKGLITIDEQNAALVEAFEAVPEKKRFQSARYSTDQSYTDWQLSLASQEIERIDRKLYELAQKEYDEEIWVNPDAYYQWKNQMGQAQDEYTLSAVRWYEKYIEYEDAFKDYKEE